MLLVIGLVLAGAGIGMMMRAFGKQPDSEHTFGSGGSTTVRIDAGETKVVFIANAAVAGGHQVHCDTFGEGGRGVEMKQFEDSLTLNQWEATFTITPGTSGNYTVTCMGAASDTFGVGESPGGALLFGSLVGVVGGVIMAMVGISVLVLTAVLRRRRSG
ncbi:hypothetical protein [Mycobacterium hubeiense]|uniref:hypothetical protein n=1 Tax=Mycobacterium hubeiense TaxID=1867256 RepID=UPI000C7E871B|nr:hypothetical protein [Mycobacterium sp. QGD 101]